MVCGGSILFCGVRGKLLARCTISIPFQTSLAWQSASGIARRKESLELWAKPSARRYLPVELVLQIPKSLLPVEVKTKEVGKLEDALHGKLLLKAAKTFHISRMLQRNSCGRHA